jgi:enamine deaminase RidA (YjgF/YER057c/UK114 family)
LSKVQTFTRAAMAPMIEPYGLAEATRVGDLLYIAGQTGMGPDGQVVGSGIRSQALHAFRSIREIIELAGGDPSDLVSLTWYLAESPRDFMADAVDVTAAREEVFPGVRTGSTAVRVKALLTPELLVEISAVAAL